MHTLAVTTFSSLSVFILKLLCVGKTTVTTFINCLVKSSCFLWSILLIWLVTKTTSNCIIRKLVLKKCLNCSPVLNAQYFKNYFVSIHNKGTNNTVTKQNKKNTFLVYLPVLQFSKLTTKSPWSPDTSIFLNNCNLLQKHNLWLFFHCFYKQIHLQHY